MSQCCIDYLCTAEVRAYKRCQHCSSEDILSLAFKFKTLIKKDFTAPKHKVNKDHDSIIMLVRIHFILGAHYFFILSVLSVDFFCVEFYF